MKRWIPVVLVVLGGAVIALSSGSEPRVGSPGPVAPSPDPSTQLPPDHPPLTDASIPAPPLGSGTGSTALTWDAPEGWTAEPPASSMRVAEYAIPGDAGPGRLIVYYFGPGQGGDARSNAERWAREFEVPGGGDPVEAAIIGSYDGGQIPVVTIETRGTYSGGMTAAGPSAEARTDYMLLGAIAQGPDANWFFKLTGPEATVAPQKAAFEEMMGSLRPGS
jgi:hypothetical protein